MLSAEIRKKFLHYFKQQGHTIVPSSPVIPHDDPTLLFINAGMNQFKDVFLGSAKRSYNRATTSQKCIRVGGKHNDLENVGHTTRHLTFFEMLGNFSFGDYFKQEAIQFAWEVSVQVFQFEEDKLWVSVFREDDEAYELWSKFLPEKRIVRLDEKDNFWAMGDTGPCGPCSELLYDRGERYGSAASPYEDTDGERFPEFWNLVFMQYNRDEAGQMEALPNQSIDTGAGLERLLAFKSGVDTVFETDIFQALFRQIERISGQKYDSASHKKAAPFRVIADHLRCLVFAISDGVQPSNLDRGYVLRKVLRRAVRYGRLLNLERPFLAELVPTLIESMGDDFKEIVEAKERVQEILTMEEEGFLRTLSRGGNLLNAVVERANSHEMRISGDDAFKLKDTYGLPIDEILLLAKDASCSVDLNRYQQLEMEAKERSRAGAKSTKQMAEDSLFRDLTPSHFVGYVQTSNKGKVVALVKDGQLVPQLKAGDEGAVILDNTPFYAEKGGQVGDSGELSRGGVHFHVADTQSPYTDIIAHEGRLEKGTLKVGDALDSHVDKSRRRRIANNHTVTHLLHWALQEVLGPTAKQAGSVVAPDRLRFDFSHHKALTEEQIRMIEDLVNDKIRQNYPVQSYELDYQEAQSRDDIKQFFGDKYGAIVRVIDIEFSKELCGGTHTSMTGNIGYFRLAKESSIAAGVRRIEAVTGAEAAALDRSSDDLLNEVAKLLDTLPTKLLDRANRLLEEHTHYTREIKQLKRRQMEELGRQLASQAVEGKVVVQIEAEPGDLRTISESIIDNGGKIVVLGAIADGKCALYAAGSQAAIDSGFHAGKIIKELAPKIGGGGGGKADGAQAGGKNPQGIEEALEAARQLLANI